MFHPGDDGSASWAAAHDAAQNQYTPRLVESLSDQIVIGASAGAEHTVARTAAGELFACGRGSLGCLGLGELNQENWVWEDGAMLWEPHNMW